MDKSESKKETIAGYNPKYNTIFIRADLSNNNKLIAKQTEMGHNYFAYANKPQSSIIHELGHWEQYNRIKVDNPKLSHVEIIEKIKENSYNLVDGLNKKGYNIRKEISEYANESSFTKPEEVYVEMFVKNYFGRKK